MEWTTEIREMVREQLIANCDEILGVRTIDDNYNVGDEVAYSYDWLASEDDDACEDEQPVMLDGACAIHIPTNQYYADSDEQVEEALKVALEIIERAYNTYEGSHAYLITGNGYNWGDDKDEIVVRDAVVLAKLI